MPNPPKTFKGQPWILFDTVASASFLLGDPNGLAIGTQTPAISRAGEIVFFSAGRNISSTPQLTNMDVNAQLAYGMEIWQIYLMLAFPIVTPNQNDGFSAETDAGVAPTEKLAECLINYGILDMDLGQEQQVSFPCTRFGSAGGLKISNSIASASVQNSPPDNANILKLPEAIECPRTQNLRARIRIAPEAFPMIGTVAAPGVGSPRQPYAFTYLPEGPEPQPITVQLPELPYAVQLGLVGRRVKFTQYGQIPGE